MHGQGPEDPAVKALLVFALFSGEWRQAQGEREARVTRDRRASLVARYI